MRVDNAYGSMGVTVDLSPLGVPACAERIGWCLNAKS